MQARFEMTVGRTNLEAIIRSFPEESAHWSEAQNRFQFVDRLLLECLGWEQPYIEVERFDDSGGRSDYLLGKPVKAALEAKKEARRFDFLPGCRPNSVRPLRPLVEACKTLKEAVSQVLTYTTMNGAQIAIVCNGPQMVIFQANIPGHSPLDSECYVFNGFQDYIGNFTLLWRLLSPEGIAENKALRELANHRNPRIPAKASTAIGELTAYRYRSSFQENLRHLASILLESIDDNPSIKTEFYRECYVPLEANNRHLLLSKNVIAARYQRVADNGISPATVATSIKGGKLIVNGSSQAGTSSSRPFVVVGDVGVGKTSFFENLFQELSDVEKQQTYYIHINLGEKATLARDVKSHILSAIPQVLKINYGIDIFSNDFVEKVYETEMEDFDKSVSGRLKSISPIDYEKAKIKFLQDKLERSDEHLQHVLSYLIRVKNKQILLVIDNADQRNFQTQQDAFLIAQELAASRNIMVFVALRPSTFYQSKLTGALSGYQNRVLTISPPPADEVLRKRITFAVRVAEGETAPAALEGVYLNVASIVLFLKATLRSIKSNNNIKTFLSNITGGNTRLVVELITGFCGSPNVESEKIVRIEGETGDYKVPLHEFTKHALLGDYSYFNGLSSLVACNVFDISSSDPREHFLSLLIIAYISSPMGLKDNDGFVSAENIYLEMTRIGFISDQVRFALKKLATKRLIETAHGHYRELVVDDVESPDALHFRATSIGIYHIRYWVGGFSFLDATSTDTPIFDEAIRGIVFNNANSLDIKHRFERATSFRSYLEAKWHDANFHMNYYDLPSIFTGQDEGFASVERVVERGPSVKKKSTWRGGR